MSRPADCLDDAEVQNLVELGASDADFDRIQRHIDACSACRELVAATAIVRSRPAAEVVAGALAAGDHVGRYAIEELLGAGNMGVVYRAHDPQLRRDVAIKVLRPARADDPELTALLLREAEAMAALAHDNVVTVHDAGQVEGRVYVAMELVRGTTLARWNASPRTWQEVRAIALQICRGLAAAHEAGVIHRDFKPDNVLIAETGRALVSDFGLARRGPETAGGSALVGTPRYMAPEQLAGATANAASDQFALCATLYEAFYRAAPFPPGPLRDRIEVLRRGPRRPARDARVPSRVFRVLARGLAFRPQDRYPSAAAVLADLERIASRKRHVLALVGLGAVAAGFALAAAASRGAPAWQPEVEPIRPLYEEALEGESLSPDGAWLAFTSDRDADGYTHLYVQAAGGGAARRLATELGDLSGPRWAADGRSVYVVDSVGGGWRVPVDGSSPDQVAAPVHEIVDCAGRLVLVYWGASGCTACQRLVLRAGGERELYRTAPGGQIAEPRCDRAGTRVVFSLSAGGPLSDIWIQPLDGGALQQVTHDSAAQNHEPAFTADGTGIVLVRQRDGAMRLVELPLADPAAARELPSGPTDAADPEVSPDGTILYFVTDESADMLFAWHLDGRPRERLTHALENVSAPVPLADGRLVATVIRDATPLLVELDPASRVERVLGEGTALGVTSDGALVYYVMSELWARPVGGGPSKPIAPMPRNTANAVLGPDRAVHLSLITRDDVEAWRIDLDSGAFVREHGAVESPAPVGGWNAVVTIAKASRGDDRATLHLSPPPGDQPPAPIVHVGPLPVVWDLHGRFVLYRRGDEIHRVSVPRGDDTVVVRAHALHDFAVSPDGATIYTVETVERTHAMRLVGFDRRPDP